MQVLKPANAIWQAMLDRLAAVSLGEAALARVRPMLEELSRHHLEVAWEALLLEWAAAGIDGGAVPQVVIVLGGGPAHERNGRGTLPAALQAGVQGENIN